MDLQKILQNIGLDEKETATYLAVLELGASSVYSIAKKAELKRPTVYRILDKLQQQGLASVVPKARQQLYTAESPEQIVADLFRKAEVMKQNLPQFLALYNTKKEKPNVQLFEGKEAVRQVYKKIYSSDEVWFFGSLREVTTLYPEEFKIYLQKITNGTLKARDLFIYSKIDVAYSKKIEQAHNYEIKFLADADQISITDCALYGNTVAFFSFHPQIFAVTLTSQEISGTFRTLYEAAWKGAKKI